MWSLNPMPKFITFDCYGTLIQWDQGLQKAVKEILARYGRSDLPAKQFIEVYDDAEHRIEQEPPHRPFKVVAGEGLKEAMGKLGLPFAAEDASILIESISRMGPFPEVPDVLRRLRERYKLAIISNTDDDLIAGNVRNIGVPIDHVITAQQAGAYKPSRKIFEHAHRVLGVTVEEVVHVAASMRLDIQACKELGIRCIWINRRGEAGRPDYKPYEELNDLSGVPDYLLPA